MNAASRDFQSLTIQIREAAEKLHPLYRQMLETARAASDAHDAYRQQQRLYLTLREQLYDVTRRMEFEDEGGDAPAPEAGAAVEGPGGEAARPTSGDAPGRVAEDTKGGGA